MSRRYRRIAGPPGSVWIHVDEPAAADRKVWAVQSIGLRGGRRYERFHDLTLVGRFETLAFDTGAQPRFVLYARGAILKRGRVLVDRSSGTPRFLSVCRVVSLD